MQMINVLKRLAELDAQNPNIVKENADLAECGMMPEMGMMGGMPERPSTPASINMTAGSGEELSNMLATIMQLAGVEKVGDTHLGAEPPPAVISMEPAMSAGDSMRSVIDKMHAGDDNEEGGDEEKADEGQYDNSPVDPTNVPEFDSEEFAHQENQPGSGNDSNGKKRQSNMPTATFESLMNEYKQFIGEAEDDDNDDDEDYDDSGPKDHYNPNSKPHPKGHLNKLLRKKLGEPEVKEGINESLDILKLAGLK